MARPINLFARRSGAAVIIRAETRADGELVAEPYVTEVFRGLEAPEERGEAAPDVPEHERNGEPEQSAFTIVADRAERYARASGDHNPIHLDEDAAKAVALRGRVLHGLSRMAVAGHAVAAVGGREPSRLAVRFPAPVTLGAPSPHASGGPAAASRSRRRTAPPPCSRAAGRRRRDDDRRPHRDRRPHPSERGRDGRDSLPPALVEAAARRSRGELTRPTAP